jgi:hypothetical protein
MPDTQLMNALDLKYPDWQFRITQTFLFGNEIIMIAELTLSGVTRAACGTASLDAFETVLQAEEQAFQRACDKFPALKQPDTSRKTEPASTPSLAAVPIPRPAFPEALVTPGQLRQINALAESLPTAAGDLCFSKFNCEPEHLTASQATQFIVSLKALREKEKNS